MKINNSNVKVSKMKVSWRKLLLLVMLPLLLKSCRENKFDLENIEFPIRKQELQNVGVDTEKSSGNINDDIITFTSDSSAVMIFGGIELGNDLNRSNTIDKKIFASNYVKFYEDASEKQILAYEVNIRTSNETALLENYFDENYGATDFYYKDEKVCCRIWEEEKNIYYFGVNFNSESEFLKEKQNTALLFVVDKNSKNILREEAPTGQYFQLYKYYLDEKELIHDKNKKFTYRDFMKKKRQENEFKEADVIYYDNYIAQ